MSTKVNPGNMDLTKCYICKCDLPLGIKQIPIKDLSIDEYDNMGRICPECNLQLNGKFALAVENYGIRTGEVVFLSRRILREVSPEDFNSDFQIYIVSPKVMKEVMKRIIQSR